MFSPYHKFASCARLEKLVADQKAGGTITDTVFAEHNRYHYALLHKLKCTRDCVNGLATTLNDAAPEFVIANSSDFQFSVNSKIDGFFYSGGSVLDILAREVLIYFGISLPGKVHYRTARQELAAARPSDPLLSRLNDPSWKDEFSTYRNAVTHELLIAGSYSINVTVDGAAQKSSIVYPLPDDPRAQPESRTFKRNKDVLIYCETTFRRLLSHTNVIYGHLCDRIQTKAALPL